MSTYYVTRIEEPDFGCEGRPEGQEIKDKVYLEEEITKEETIIFMEDKLLYERDINEGMKDYRKRRIDHERSDKRKDFNIDLRICDSSIFRKLITAYIQSC